MSQISTRRVIVTALLVDVVDIVTNAFVAIISGSAVMLVETVAGVADAISMFLLLIGNKRSSKKATKLHPFGHGKEQYFWATLAGFLILLITANLSLFFGLHALRNPEPVSYLGLTYAVLIIAVLTNGYAFRQAARKLLAGRAWRDLRQAFTQSWDTAAKTAMIMDAMGTVSALIGLVSLVAYGLTGNSTLDAWGAIAMAIAMGFFSILLLVGTRSLVTGQSAPQPIQDAIWKAVSSIPEVHEVVEVQTMILGTEDMLANIQVNLKNDLTTDDIEKTVARITSAVEKADPYQKMQISVELVPPSRNT